MGRCVIDQPMNEVIRFLEDHGRRKEWDKYLAVWRNICCHRPFMQGGLIAPLIDTVMPT